MEKIIYAKTLNWEHESEYRLAIPIRQGEDWNTLPYHPEEITELYLGLAMTKQNKDEIVNMAMVRLCRLIAASAMHSFSSLRSQAMHLASVSAVPRPKGRDFRGREPKELRCEFSP